MKCNQMMLYEIKSISRAVLKSCTKFIILIRKLRTKIALIEDDKITKCWLFEKRGIIFQIQNTLAQC